MTDSHIDTLRQIRADGYIGGTVPGDSTEWLAFSERVKRNDAALDAAIAALSAPAGCVVDDAMVKRAIAAYMNHDDYSVTRELVRAMLIAALAAAPAVSGAGELNEDGEIIGCPMVPQATPPPAVSDPATGAVFRNLSDGASFEDYRDQLAVGNLTAVDQMAFDNRLHDREADHARIVAEKDRRIDYWRDKARALTGQATPEGSS